MSELTRHVIVFESQPFWEPELQRQFLDEDVIVGACRSVKDLESRLARQSYDVCVADLTADVTGLLRWLGVRLDQSGIVPVIVVAREEQQSLEWHVRELGAASFTNEYVTGKQLAAMCRKQWNHQSNATL
ncbi:MAG: hypothetical protein KDA93_01935 [Planctomycetaceae bacterium]|nr:hypothetical protein [Planctomycetaceae bacterium]